MNLFVLGSAYSGVPDPDTFTPSQILLQLLSELIFNSIFCVMQPMYYLVALP